MEKMIHEIIVEIEINRSKEVVWEAMLNEVSAWWPKDFLCLPGDSEIKFEPWAGGRLFEEKPDGSCLLWGNVLMIVPGESIELSGFVSPTYGGPSLNFIKTSIESGESGNTLFRLSNTVLGRFTAEGESEIDAGWKYLYGSLKAYCEAK